MPRKLMILGAGIYQLPLILKARELGLETLVVSYAGNYPGFAAADRVLELDTTDAEGVLAAAMSEHVDGIVTTGTDVAVRSVGRVCDALGLSGISERAARILTDKAVMKRAFKEGGVCTSDFEVVSALDEALAASERLGYPVMVKACDVSGSRGVTKVSSQDEVAPAFEAALAATHTDHVIVEKFVAGTEIGVDGFVRNGELALFAPHTKMVCRAGSITIPSGHAFPFGMSEGVFQEVKRQLELVVAASGMNNCAVNGDFIVQDDGVVQVLEAGGRCGATGIPELISLHYGIDYYALMIKAALGEPCDFTPRSSVPCMSRLLFSDVTARVKAIDSAAVCAVEEGSGATVGIDVKPGELIHAVHDGTDRFGQIVMPTDDVAAIEAVAARVLECIEVAR